MLHSARGPRQSKRLKPHRRSTFTSGPTLHVDLGLGAVLGASREAQMIEKSKRDALYYQKNKEKIKAHRKRWYQSVKSRQQEINRAYIRSRPELKKKLAEGYRGRHRLEIQAKAKTKNLEVKKKTFSLLGGKCLRCGFLDIRALQIDHINGCEVSAAERCKAKERGDALYRAILRGEKDMSKYQLLCANCNVIKKFQNGEVAGYRKKIKKNDLHS